MTAAVLGQSVEADVKVESNHLDDVQRQAVSQLAADIEYYIESAQWTFDDLPTDLKVQATLYLESYTESGSDRIYSGKAYWGNGDDQKYFDKSVQFTFYQGQTLSRSRSFNSLTSFIDYWVLVILGSDLDTWFQFGGSQLYSEASRIARSGTSSRYSLGWKDRLEDVDILSRNQDFRKMKFTYYEAIDLWDSGNKDDAKKTVQEFLKNLETSKRRQGSRIFTENFLNAKHQELADFLWEIGEVSNLTRLMRIDEKHGEYYQGILADW